MVHEAREVGCARWKCWCGLNEIMFRSHMLQKRFHQWLGLAIWEFSWELTNANGDGAVGSVLLLWLGGGKIFGVVESQWASHALTLSKASDPWPHLGHETTAATHTSLSLSYTHRQQSQKLLIFWLSWDDARADLPVWERERYIYIYRTRSSKSSYLWA